MPVPILLFVQMHHEKSCQAKIMLIMSANSQYIAISTCMHEYIQQTNLRVDLIFYDLYERSFSRVDNT